MPVDCGADGLGVGVKAYIYPDLVDRIDEYFKGTEGHKTDPDFLALAERIAGQTVDLVFTGTDAFEAVDNNYWLPDCCWKSQP